MDASTIKILMSGTHTTLPFQYPTPLWNVPKPFTTHLGWTLCWWISIIPCTVPTSLYFSSLLPSNVCLFDYIWGHWWQESCHWLMYLSIYYLWASLVAQLVKNLPAMRETWVWSLGWEDTLEEGKVGPLQYSGLENSMDSIVCGVAKNRTWMSDIHFASLHLWFIDNLLLVLIYAVFAIQYVVVVKLLSCAWLCSTVVHQAPLSMGFPR